jgi:hypothetical protein
MAIKSYAQFVKKANHLGKAHKFGAPSRPKQSGPGKLVKKIIKWVKNKIQPKKRR